MTEQNQQDNKDLQLQSPLQGAAVEFDPGFKALSRAFRVSFFILKLIMILLVLLFLASGFRTVANNEEALVLRFGKICGKGENRILKPGLHWLFPYPIDQIIKIPVASKIDLTINSFWYYQKASELLPESPKDSFSISEVLYPNRDGYCITRSEQESQNITGLAGSDYNIVHSKWQLTYQIDDPERFFKNVYIEDIQPGQPYFDAIKKSVTPMLLHLVEDSVVTAMVNYTIDEALSSHDRIPRHVKGLLQEKLDKINSGIAVVSVKLTEVIWPRQVNYAFLANISASQQKDTIIKEAQTYAENTLIEAESLAQKEIADATAYRTEVVETAKANAEYMHKLLPEYRQRPQLVIQQIYQDAIEYVLSSVDEKMIIQPTKGAKGKEIRIQLNRDPKLKPRTDKVK